MINSDRIHVAMTKTCGPVATLACQSNTFKQTKMQISLSLAVSLLLSCTNTTTRTLLLLHYSLLSHADLAANHRRCPTAHTLCQRSCYTESFFIFIFVFNKEVALAVKCCHSSAHFRHRNVYLIRVDHLPLGKL